MATSNNASTDALKESVLKNLRSVTQSRKGGVPLNALERDYEALLGTPIPYRQFGHSSLLNFLKDIPKVIDLKQKGGHWYVEGIADDSTAHIVSLINRQKTVPIRAKPSRRPYVNKRGRYNPNYNSNNLRPVQHRPAFQPEHRNFKPTPSISRETKPKAFKPPSPEPARVQQSQQKKYIAPRFLKQQQQQQQQRREVINQSPPPAQPLEQNNFRSSSPTKQAPRDESPDLFLENYDYINHIKSPRPLLTRTIINDQYKALKVSGSAKESIIQYATVNNLPYEFKSSLIGQKKKNKNYVSCLTLDGKKYNSYPEEAATKEEAEELAAKNAVKAIEESQEHLASYPETSLRNSEDVQILIDRIEEIVCEKPSGMFTNGITNEYENKFNETLPENWLQLLHQSTIIEIEELDVPYGRVPEGVSCIVRKKKISSGSTTPSSPPLDIGEDGAVPRNIIRKDHLPSIPQLTMPLGNEWGVYIVDVSKTIAARLYDYDKQFIIMSENMQTYYTSESLPAIEITEGLLYAAKDADSDIYHRVLVQNIKENYSVECYYVDEGVFTDVRQSDLQELHEDFWKLPYQAIHMTLDGFDDFIFRPDDLNCLLGLTLIALVKRGTTTVNEYFPKDPAVHKTIYSVALFNTDDPEVNVNMNDVIKSNLFETYIPRLPQPSVSEGGYYLTHVDDTGEVYLRNLPLDSWLETSLDTLASDFEEACVDKTTVTLDEMCVAKYEDGKWYRAMLLPNHIEDDEKVKVVFIDYGNTSIVSTKEVCELQNYSDFLSHLRPQVIKCELFNPLPSPDVEWTPEASVKLMDLAPLTEELLIRVITESNDHSLPKVNLYKRIYQGGDSFIISINESIANKAELFKKTMNKPTALPIQNSFSKLKITNEIRPPVPKSPFANYNKTVLSDNALSTPTMPYSPTNDLKWALTPDNIKSPDALDNYEPPSLELPQIPDVGDMFDVFVTMAAHPHNFYVQPYKTISEMYNLLNQMSSFYKSEENQIDMHLSLLKENGYYAVKYSKDNFWYRAQLLSVINSDPIQVIVKFVDFGDILTVTNMQQIQRLYAQFRKLPCQGIQASLADVQPIEKDWSAMQSFEFKNLVQEKRFVSIIKNKSYRPDASLELKLVLIDVNDPKKDVYIHELLIQQGKAARV